MTVIVTRPPMADIALDSITARRRQPEAPVEAVGGAGAGAGLGATGAGAGAGAAGAGAGAFATGAGAGAGAAEAVADGALDGTLLDGPPLGDAEGVAVAGAGVAAPVAGDADAVS